jgi:putative ATP-dependent endonuclease of OLD family
MKIVRLQITNFRCIKHGIFFSEKFNVLLGPNNVGKTAVLEALNLALNPEISGYSQAITENDFFQRRYQSEAVSAPAATPPESLPVAAAPAPAAVVLAAAAPAAPAADPSPAAAAIPAQPPTIRIECVLTDLDEGDEDLFYKYLVPWESAARSVRESAPGDLDPFATAQKAIRIVFEGWDDPLEDDFAHKSYFLPAAALDRDDCEEVTRTHKRRIGFLIYRDFRGLTRPITLEPGVMFARLLESQEVAPKHFEEVLDRLQGAFEPNRLLLSAQLIQGRTRALPPTRRPEYQRIIVRGHRSHTY